MKLSIVTLFPVLLIAGLLCFFAYYIFAMTPRKGTLEWISCAQKEDVGKRFSFTAPLHPMKKQDALPILILTAIYALSAFWNLGNAAAPERFLNLKNGQSVTFSTTETVDIGRIEHYNGLWTGSYQLQFSEDGNIWTNVTLEQQYSRLFYWVEPKLPEGEHKARYFKLTASCAGQIELGELAFFDTNDNLILMQPDAGAEALFDEQYLAPEKPHWTNSAYFDEIYHARTAYEHLRNVAPYEDSHPPLGKLIIGLGIACFGMNPFGWRFMGTLFGVLMVPLLYIFLKNLFGKTVVATCGAALFAFDFMHLTQTRIATIDSYGVFFILAMYYFLYRYLALPAGTPFRKCALPLFLSGLMFGLGIASKWIVIYGGVGLALLYFIALFWKCRDWPEPTKKHRNIPARGPWVCKTILFSVLCFVIIPAIIYIASYLPIKSAEGLDTWREFFKYVWDNQVFMLTYHQGVNASHPYSSRWYQWIFDIRPILYYMDNSVAGFTTRFASFNNPLVSWGGLLALVVTAVQTVRRRCGKGLFIIIAFLSQFLPWVFIGRILFAYHYFPSILFLCFALAYVINDLVGSGHGWKGAVYGLTGTAAGLYAAFYPLLVGIQVPTWYTGFFLRWLPSWPL